MLGRLCTFPPSLLPAWARLIQGTCTRHMGADEMRTITTDKWTDDIWGIGSENDCGNDHGAGGLPRLYFYFGKNDHWVAEQTRDEIIALRGGGGSRTGTGTGIGPKMLVCEDGVPHAFCLSEFVFFYSLGWG